MANNTQLKTLPQKSYPLLTPKERISVWEKVRGMWKHRNPDPEKELQRIRKEWDRPVMPLRK